MKPQANEADTCETCAPAVRLPVLVKSDARALPPHDAAVRRAAELLCDGSPMVKTGHACNLECTYCCNRAAGPALVPRDALVGIVDGLAALGYRGIGYMGGEPTIHPDFPEVVRHARSRGFETQLLATNGVRLADGALTDRLFSAGINSVTVSLDTFDAEVQERLYGGRAQLGDALVGLRRVLEAPGVDVLVSSVVTAPIVAQLPAYVETVAGLQERHQKPVGIMLCLLQQPFRNGPAQRALPLGLLESARVTIAALARAKALGVAAITFGFPPCVLEGFELNVSELYATEWVVDVATGEVERSRLGDAGAYWAACTTCPHAGYCEGVKRQYANADVRAFIERNRR